MSEDMTSEVNPAAQRRLMFGSNAVLMAILALLVAVVLLGLAYLVDASYHFEFKMGTHTLSDSTRARLADLDKKQDKYRIISLFTDPSDETRRDDVKMSNKLFHQRKEVNDLLAQYKRYSSNITVEDKGDASVDELRKMIRDRYKNDFKAYKDAFNDFGSLAKNFSAFLDQETAKISAAAQRPASGPATQPDAPDSKIPLMVQSIFASLMDDLKSQQALVTRESGKDLTDWTLLRDVTLDGIHREDQGVDQSGLREMQDILKSFDPVRMQAFQKEMVDQKAPPEYQVPNYLIEYFKANNDAYTKMAEQLKKYQDRLEGLSPLKEAQEVMANLTRNTILVVGDKSAKVVTYKEIYPKFDSSQSEDESFTGESAITDDLYCMAFPEKRSKVVFVSPTPQHMIEGTFSTIKAKLERKNFEVLEWAPVGEENPQMPGMAPPGEPPPQTVKGDVWVVFPPDAPRDPRQPPPDTQKVEAAVKAHLDKGGGVLFIATSDGNPDPRDVPYHAIMAQYGMEVQSQYRIVHQVTVVDSRGIKRTPSIPYVGRFPQDTRLQDEQRMSLVQFLDSPMVVEKDEITDSMKGLPLLAGPTSRDLEAMSPQQQGPDRDFMAVVRVIQPAPTGVNAKEIVKTPFSKDIWADSTAPNGAKITQPVPIEARSIKNAGSKDERRVAVLGCKMLASNMFIGESAFDESTFLGNETLFRNTVSWLAGQDISTEATTVAYVEMSSSSHFTFTLILLVLMPVLVLGAAAAALMSRRR